MAQQTRRERGRGQNMRIAVAAVVAALVATGLGGGVAHARPPAGYWVSPAGDDAGPGTSWRPFRTIQKAATVAVAGDTVTIRNGTYAEPTITVQNSGTAARPITFQAEHYRGVRLTDGDNDGELLYSNVDESGAWSSFYITVRGIVFGPVTRLGAANCSGPNNGSVAAARGWRFEDSVLDRAYPLVARGESGDVDDITILRTVFTDSYNNSSDIIGNSFVTPVDHAQNTRFVHVVIRRSNFDNCSPGGYAGANKHLFTNGMLYDGVISYDNNGNGSWLDYDNHNYTVRNSTFFGNHAGHGVEPNGTILDQWWAGTGFVSEANGGPALIEDNVFYSNLYGGYAHLDSGKDGATAIRGNTFVDNGRAIEFRGLRDTYQRELGPAVITHNVFKQPRETFWHTSVEQYLPCDAPPGCANVIDHNTYEPPPGGLTDGQWAYWTSSADPPGTGRSTTASSLADLRGKLGVEAHGSQRALPFRGRLVPTFAYPPEDEAVSPDRAKMRQVHSDAAEANGIDAALAGKRVGDTVTIPVYGRTPVTANGDGTFTVEVHDLQARYVTLRVQNWAARTALQNAVTPYAILDATRLEVKLTQRSEYHIEATLRRTT